MRSARKFFGVVSPLGDGVIRYVLICALSVLHPEIGIVPALDLRRDALSLHFGATTRVRGLFR